MRSFTLSLILLFFAQIAISQVRWQTGPLFSLGRMEKSTPSVSNLSTFTGLRTKTMVFSPHYGTGWWFNYRMDARWELRTHIEYHEWNNHTSRVEWILFPAGNQRLRTDAVSQKKLRVIRVPFLLRRFWGVQERSVRPFLGFGFQVERFIKSDHFYQVNYSLAFPNGRTEYVNMGDRLTSKRVSEYGMVLETGLRYKRYLVSCAFQFLLGSSMSSQIRNNSESVFDSNVMMRRPRRWTLEIAYQLTGR